MANSGEEEYPHILRLKNILVLPCTLRYALPYVGPRGSAVDACTSQSVSCVTERASAELRQHHERLLANGDHGLGIRAEPSLLCPGETDQLAKPVPKRRDVQGVEVGPVFTPERKQRRARIGLGDLASELSGLQRDHADDGELPPRRDPRAQQRAHTEELEQQHAHCAVPRCRREGEAASARERAMGGTAGSCAARGSERWRAGGGGGSGGGRRARGSRSPRGKQRAPRQAGRRPPLYL
eukprot:scaffold3422_cov28-Tisochrysis_lutea.AAC.4